MESAASLEVHDVTIRSCSVGMQLVDASAAVDNMVVAGAHAASVAAVGASRLDVSNSTLGTPSPAQEGHDGADESMSCIVATCTSRGSPHLSVTSSLLQQCPSAGVAVVARQTPGQPVACAARVRIDRSVIRECRQALVVAHGGHGTEVVVVDSLLIRNDVRWLCPCVARRMISCLDLRDAAPRRRWLCAPDVAAVRRLKVTYTSTVPR